MVTTIIQASQRFSTSVFLFKPYLFTELFEPNLDFNISSNLSRFEDLFDNLIDIVSLEDVGEHLLGGSLVDTRLGSTSSHVNLGSLKNLPNRDRAMIASPLRQLIRICVYGEAGLTMLSGCIIKVGLKRYTYGLLALEFMASHF